MFPGTKDVRGQNYDVPIVGIQVDELTDDAIKVASS